MSAAGLEGEIGKGERRAAEPPHGDGADRQHGASRATVEASPSADSGDELVVLRVLLGDQDFARRAARELRADQFEHPHLRRMFEILAAGETPPPDLADLWESLSVPLGAGFNAETEYAERVERMRDRARQRELARIEAELPFADAAEQQRMTVRKTELMAAGPPRQRRKALKAERGPKY